MNLELQGDEHARTVTCDEKVEFEPSTSVRLWVAVEPRCSCVTIPKCSGGWGVQRRFWVKMQEAMRALIPDTSGFPGRRREAA